MEGDLVERPIALAALGAVALARRAFPPDADPLALQALVALALSQGGDDELGGQGAASIALTLAVPEKELEPVLRALRRDGLIHDEAAWDEEADPVFALTRRGRQRVEEWLAGVRRLFGGWPAVRTGVARAPGPDPHG